MRRAFSLFTFSLFLLFSSVGSISRLVQLVQLHDNSLHHQEKSANEPISLWVCMFAGVKEGNSKWSVSGPLSAGPFCRARERAVVSRVCSGNGQSPKWSANVSLLSIAEPSRQRQVKQRRRNAERESEKESVRRIMYKQPENVKLICLWALLNWCSLIWKPRLEESVYMCIWKRVYERRRMCWRRVKSMESEVGELIKRRERGQKRKVPP